MPTTWFGYARGMSGSQPSTQPVDIMGYQVMPFGLANTPTVFQASVNDVLRDMLNWFVFVYLDDILFFSRSAQEHVLHVRQVFQRLLENQLFVTAEKCEFHRSTITFLGYVIAEGNVQMDPGKVKAVVDWPQPTSRLRFLGFSNFYRCFIRDYSTLSATLSALTSPNVPFKWSPAVDKAFASVACPSALTARLRPQLRRNHLHYEC